MSLAEVALNLGVKRRDTHKLYFGQYAYSLTVMVPEGLVRDFEEAKLQYWRSLQKRRSSLGKTGSKINWSGAQKSLGAIRKSYNDSVKDFVAEISEANADILHNWDFTFNAKTVNFYVRNADTVKKLLLNNPKLFIRYSQPFNEKCEAFLAKGDPKVLVRQHLFEGKFEYRITFKTAPGLDYTELDDRLSRLYFTDKSYSYGSYTRTLYLSGEDDLFLARLGLEDQIEKITKCVEASSL